MFSYRVMYHGEHAPEGRIQSRHHTERAACRACDRYQRALRAEDPYVGRRFSVWEMVGSEWKVIYDTYNGSYADNL